MAYYNSKGQPNGAGVSAAMSGLQSGGLCGAHGNAPISSGGPTGPQQPSNYSPSQGFDDDKFQGFQPSPVDAYGPSQPGVVAGALKDTPNPLNPSAPTKQLPSIAFRSPQGDVIGHGQNQSSQSGANPNAGAAASAGLSALGVSL